LTDTAFSQGGYDDNWLRLKARYQNGRILVFAAIAKIVDYKPIDGSSRQLRALHATIKNSMSTLRNLEICTKKGSNYRVLSAVKTRSVYVSRSRRFSHSPTEVPLLESVLAFLERRSGMLETLDAQPMRHTKTLVSRDNNCKICNIGSHRHKHPESTAPVVANSANPNDRQGVCVGPRTTAEYVRITRHSHCGSTRTNCKARKLSRYHRPWLSAKSHV